MSRRHLIHPDVRDPLEQLLAAIPGGFNSIPDIVQRRATVTHLLAAMEIPPNPNVTSEDRQERDSVELRDHRHRALGPRGQHRSLEMVPR
jgi:hypothetical protein